MVNALLDAAEEQVTILCRTRGAEVGDLGAITLEALGELRRCGEVEVFAELASNLLGLPAIPVDGQAYRDWHQRNVKLAKEET